jgi:dipeptidyl aminopeptidase/acylaminoacyl peptidase
MSGPMRGLAAVGLSALLVVGCGGGREQPTRPERATTTQRAVDTGALRSALRGTTIRFRASDGVLLEGNFIAGRGRAPAVVLIHEYRGGPQQWESLLPELHEAGYAVLNYASRSAQEIDETVLARDVVGAVSALGRRDDIDGRRIALVGASIGASAAVWTVGVYRKVPVRAAAGLTAIEGPALLDVSEKGRFRPHDLLLIADKREFSEAQHIREDAKGRGVTMWMSPIRGHGVAMLASAKVRRKVLEWLRAHLGRG